MQVFARLTAAGVTGGLLLTGLTTLPAAADDRPLPPGRFAKTYTVKPGDTATGLAVRFHAWTAELISHNHLGGSATLRVGQRIEIPVVRAAARKDRRHRSRAPHRRHRKPAAHTRTHTKKHAKPHRHTHARAHPQPRRTAHPSRAYVRRVIVDTARRHGVDPRLALAVSWQESGWQMHRTSSAHAIGAMQVLPATGAWMSLYAGRHLRLRHTRDNVLAGVLLLGVLDDQTRTRRHQVAAYYQGLGAVREHGLYRETRAYVRNVRAIHRRLQHGLPPA
jgi:LysM repeat protein